MGVIAATRRRLPRLRTLVGTLMVLAADAGAAQTPAGRALVSDERIAVATAAVAGQLDPRAAAALARVEGLGPQLLALRAYLRAGKTLADRWSWTAGEIERYEGSALQHALEAEVDRVRATFEAANPGYTLWVNRQVRSLELQLERWNDNASVDAAGTALLGDLREAMATAPAGRARTREWLRGFLASYVLPRAPTLAAPGLSAHGRMGAVDFQVRQGEQTVAAPSVDEIDRVWNAQGWRDRLNLAVRRASRQFHGPLQVPDEPWHYEYRPAAGVLAEQ
jgi:hypothetical protein